jgi:hypothetical protein
VDLWGRVWRADHAEAEGESECRGQLEGERRTSRQPKRLVFGGLIMLEAMAKGACQWQKGGEATSGGGGAGLIGLRGRVGRTDPGKASAWQTSRERTRGRVARLAHPMTRLKVLRQG